MKKENNVILLVEDNENIRADMVEAIQMEWGDVTVLQAENGKVGWELAQQKPSLIISDVRMPVMDGCQLLMALHEDEALKAIPFVFVTAEDCMCELAEELSIRTIRKPLHIALFIQELSDWLGTPSKNE